MSPRVRPGPDGRQLLAALLVATGVAFLGSALAAGEGTPPLAEIVLDLEPGTVQFGEVMPGSREYPDAVRLTVSSELHWRLLARASPPDGTALEWSTDGVNWTPFPDTETVLLDDQPPTAGPAHLNYFLRLVLDWSVLPGTYSTPIAYRVEFNDQDPPGVLQFLIAGGAGFTRFREVILTLEATDPSGVGSMRFSDDGAAFGEWVDHAGSYGYLLPDGDGLKRVWVQFRDRAGNVSGPVSAGITLDTVPPAISGVAVIDVGAEAATVIWLTDELASSRVEYGPTGAYGLWSPLLPGPVTSHSVTLTGLQSAITYHYRAHSVDRAGNESVSGPLQFSTGVLPPRNLTASATGNHVDLRWDATLTADPSGYRVWRRNVLSNEVFQPLETVSGTTLSYRDSQVLKGLSSYWFEYRVTAVKTGYPESVPSNVATIRNP